MKKKYILSIFIFGFLFSGIFYFYNGRASSETINKPMYSKVDEIETEIYQPFIDDNWNLWGLEGSALKVSEDFGETWNEWYDFKEINGGAARLPIYGAVYISKKGYIFVGLEDGKVYRSNEPYGKKFAVVNELSNPKATLNVWNITEDNEGVMYHGEYANLINPDYNAESDLKEEMFISVAYVYKSTQNGAAGTWENIGPYLDKNGKKSFVWDETNSLTGGDKHIHSTQVNPYTNTLYVTYGDWNRSTWKSEDKGENWIKTEAGEGYTGFTFTENAIYGATDFPYASNNQFSKSTDGIHFEKTLDLEGSLDTATFDMHSHVFGDKTRVIGIIHDEWDEQYEFQSAVVYTENEGETWEVLASTPKASTDPVFIGLAHGRNSMIPKDFPYWIVSNHWTRADIKKTGNMKLTRIPVTNIASKVIIPDSEIKKGATNFKIKAIAVNGIKKIELLVNGKKNACNKEKMECQINFKKAGTQEIVLRVYDEEGKYSESATEVVDIKN